MARIPRAEKVDQQLLDVFPAHALDDFLVGLDRGVNDVALPLLKLNNLLLHRAAGNQLDAVDRPLLTDAVRAVRGLILNRRVPPRVKMNNHVGAGQVQPRAPRLQADKEHRYAPLRVELVHNLHSVLRRTVKVAVAQLTLVELFPQDLEH